MRKYLEQINSPEDIKNLDEEALQALAAELRAYVLDIVSQNGGHLASNLGVVELTLALHKVFDTSRDRIVWDVGHQTYVHKIITGRREAFKTLRQWQGLAGFPKREESCHDAYDTGHSSTSISAALGFAKARDLKGESHRVAAVIGDGSMTGGEAFEALNLAASLETDVLVILNDNHMSIAPNIGGMSDYLNRIRTSVLYNRSKLEIRKTLGKIPFIGGALVKGIERFKEGIKLIMIPGMVFTELGFSYYGPVDGHDIKALIENLQKLKDMKGPVLLHVLTRKGKGYLPAQKDACTYHGIAPFDLETGKICAAQPKTPTYTKAFSDTMVKIAEKDPRVLAITAAMSDGTGLGEFARRFPDRFIDVGIAEQTAVTLGTALALSGFKPVVSVYSTFLQRAYDQMIQDTAIQDAPVIFALDRAGLVGEDGPTHHGAFDLSYLRSIPGMAIMVPRDEQALQSMLWTACGHDQGPVAIRYPRGKAQGLSLSETPPLLEWGKGEILRHGKEALVLAVGPLIYEALAAAEQLANHGILVGVADARFVKPLDDSMILDLCSRYPLILTLEENVIAGGFGAAVMELLAARQQQTSRVYNLGLPDWFVPHGSQKKLLAGLGLDAQGIAHKITELLERDVSFNDRND
ncbi:MAG TPA: 1-deoxy-D-xylulose-5-phosphate synthase [Peptococcaceae bacterium]|nr:1-deoxy-D-xylulose-5-phosphate synthase [Peptococcaceae bacterium]